MHSGNSTILETIQRQVTSGLKRCGMALPPTSLSQHPISALIFVATRSGYTHRTGAHLVQIGALALADDEQSTTVVIFPEFPPTFPERLQTVRYQHEL